jgi:hypothetical protein
VYYDIPSDPAKQKQLLTRFMRENLAVEANIQASRRRPQPPRSLSAIGAAPHVQLSWAPPQSMSGVVGFNVYQGDEGNRIANINNPETLNYVVPLTVSLPVAFYISCYTSFLESIKVRVLAS